MIFAVNSVKLMAVYIVLGKGYLILIFILQKIQLSV